MKDPIVEIKKILPADLIDRGIYLGDFGLHEIIWNSKDIITVINFLNGQGIFISGGCVYEEQGEKIILTWAGGWNSEIRLYLPTKEELAFSKKNSIEYIQNYIKKNGDNFWFSLTIFVA